jgi:hypothetical protein
MMKRLALANFHKKIDWFGQMLAENNIKVIVDEINKPNANKAKAAAARIRK